MSMNLYCPTTDCKGNVNIPNGVEDGDVLECDTCRVQFRVALDVHLEAISEPHKSQDGEDIPSGRSSS